ncbi:DUF6086 family protein [Actinoallomurus rhizosphaericola]|uniref:DUF6086 family protein n=1 Tax=Actinoallomurus rhizosphaericola TaxID=2952536 RepID=UPI002092792C|nr:DUF6086 family protein [Actinoallomurus rhizosphaericola]MCO5996301.1 DUF6086 family protein [Actinoallomurus rhizosphaericola]
MSCLFRIGEESVWTPSAEAGRLYVGMTKCLAAGGGRATGVRTIAEDVFEIAPEPFGALVEVAYKEYFNSTNRVYRSQLHGWLLTSLVLLARAGRPVTPSNDEEREFVEDISEHAKAMPS